MRKTLLYPLPVQQLNLHHYRNAVGLATELEANLILFLLPAPVNPHPIDPDSIYQRLLHLFGLYQVHYGSWRKGYRVPVKPILAGPAYARTLHGVLRQQVVDYLYSPEEEYEQWTRLLASWEVNRPRVVSGRGVRSEE